MRIIAAAVMMTLIAGPVLAQTQAPMQQYREEDKPKTPAQLEADKQAERDYRRSLNSVPNKQQTDPWGIARSDGTQQGAAKAPAKPAAKTAAPKQAKPASAAN